jgi:hypothetical protein
MTKATTFKANIVTTAIEANGEAILSALSALDTAASQTADAIRTAMQSMVDAAASAGLKKEQSSVDWFGQQIREAQVFIDAIAEGGLEKKTVTEYAQGAMRAHFHGVEWTPRLKNDPSMGLPWGKQNVTAKKAGARPSKGKKANPLEDAKSSVLAALAALRAANMAEFAADVLDLAVDTWPEFKEPAAPM